MKQGAATNTAAKHTHNHLCSGLAWGSFTETTDLAGLFTIKQEGT